MRPLGVWIEGAQPNGPFTDNDKKALIAFLLSMTDERVKYHKALFDHPHLPKFLGLEQTP